MGKNDNKLQLGKVLHYFDKLPSTNDLAAKWLNSETPEQGTVIVAGEQTKGRGRRGRSWFTGSDNNLALSVIVYPLFLNLNDQFYLNKIVSLALSDTILELGINDALIKWPNDIYIGEYKVAGILIQNSIQSNKIQSCIMGIGLNVNQAQFPENVPNPTSLYLETKKLYDLKALLQILLNKLSIRYTQLAEGKRTELDEVYIIRLYRKRGNHRFLTSGGRVISGRVLRVSARGDLIIKDQEDMEISFSFNEIKFI